MLFRSILTGTAVDKGSSGYDTAYGYGLVDIGAAVARAAGDTGSGSSGSGSSGSGSSGSGSSGPGSSGSGSSGSGSSGSGSSGSGSSGSADTTAPTISHVSGYTQGTRFTIEWTTNEAANSYVDFSGIGAYGDDTMVTSHSLSFTGSRGTTYVFTIESTDAAGNQGTDGQWQISL